MTNDAGHGPRRLCPVGVWIESRQAQRVPRTSDSAIGTAVNLSRQQIGEIKRGTSKTKPEVLEKIAEFFGEDPKPLLAIAYLGESTNTADVDALEIAGYIANLPERERERIKRMVREYAA